MTSAPYPHVIQASPDRALPEIRRNLDREDRVLVIARSKRRAQKLKALDSKNLSVIDFPIASTTGWVRAVPFADKYYDYIYLLRDIGEYLDDPYGLYDEEEHFLHRHLMARLIAGNRIVRFEEFDSRGEVIPLFPKVMN
jgi:hypothetical protein